MNNNLRIGVPHIDQKRNELFRSLRQLIPISSCEATFSESFSRLTNQIHDIFRAEEIFMARLNLPATVVIEHERAHTEIIEGLTEIHLKSMFGSRVPFEEVVNRVSLYLNHHAIEHDLPLKAYITT